MMALSPLRYYWYAASRRYWDLGGLMPEDEQLPDLERVAADLERDQALRDWLAHDLEVTA
jgi:hypothetical protein